MKNQSPKVAFYTLGCKLNQSETESLADKLRGAGYQIVAPGDVADIYVANTCTVTHVADRKSRHWLRMVRRRNPQAFIIATGCYAQRVPRELVPLADVVLGNEEKLRLPQIVGQKFGPVVGSCVADVSQPPCSEGVVRKRTMIKIQDGCRYSCAYCIVPYVRPHEYSLPVSEIIEKIKTKEAKGCKEVVLTGATVGRYNHDGAGIRVLLERILENTHIERLRLSSLQPQELSDELLSLWQDKRLCRHFHLALQSGSGTVLRRMKRCYSPADYRAAAQRIQQAVPGVAITTDVIVGFPGESDEEFEESHDFCRQIGLADIHVFPFSPRKGTLAADMDGQSKDSVKKKRGQRMLKLADEARQTFYRQFLGHTLPVLWERKTRLHNGIYSGLTDNYIRVYVQGDASMVNMVMPVRLKGVCSNGMQGEPVL